MLGLILEVSLPAFGLENGVFVEDGVVLLGYESLVFFGQFVVAEGQDADS